MSEYIWPSSSPKPYYSSFPKSTLSLSSVRFCWSSHYYSCLEGPGILLRPSSLSRPYSESFITLPPSEKKVI